MVLYKVGDQDKFCYRIHIRYVCFNDEFGNDSTKIIYVEESSLNAHPQRFQGRSRMGTRVST